MAKVQIGSKPVGSKVLLKVQGRPRSFIIVRQENLSAIYDESCNGTWLLMEDVCDERKWNNSNYNNYAGSTIHIYLNREFLSQFDSGIQKAIKQVRVPYRAGAGYDKTISSGVHGLSTKIFLLSAEELGFQREQMPTREGETLTYFRGCSPDGTDDKRIAKLNNIRAVAWYTRTPYCHPASGVEDVFSVNYQGTCLATSCAYGSTGYGIRPALVLPPTLMVADDGTVITNIAPSVPSSITLPSTIKGGASCSVSWSAATDPDGNLEGYIVERSYNGGSSWS
ncbi:MAG: DUF6273 domain-containing protein, partial [Butyricicoccus sp.]